MSEQAHPPLISVLIPAYNHERYVKSCLASVLAQDYPRMELVLIDDGSSDGTWRAAREMLPECERRFERVVFRTQPNQGLCETWNRLAREARGDFVALIASDDAYLPGAFSALIAPMLAEPDVGLVVGQNELMDDDDRRCYWDARLDIVYDETVAKYRYFNERILAKAGMTVDDPSFGAYRTFVRGNYIANGYLIRKEMLDRVLPYRREAPLEDLWLHLQFSKIARYRSIATPTFRYRWHAANTARRIGCMERMTVQTLLWERENVRRLADPRWAAEFAAAETVEKTVISMGPFLRLFKRRSIGRKQRVLRILSWEWVLGDRRFGQAPDGKGGGR